ncbi:hypothetical protein ESA2_CDS100 [Staphylococcus phage ESa2]|nr:hypothetical protein ESA2_CDS100 [Staphylococcus phage ESa2]
MSSINLQVQKKLYLIKIIWKSNKFTFLRPCESY